MSETAAEVLWAAIGDLFANNVDDLDPRRQLTPLRSDAADEALQFLIARADRLRPDQTAWDVRTEADVPVGEAPDAALRAANRVLAAVRGPARHSGERRTAA